MILSFVILVVSYEKEISVEVSVSVRIDKIARYWEWRKVMWKA